MSLDLDALERDYRADTLSNRELARQHGISEAYVRKLAKEKDWKRNLTRAIRQATEIMVERKEAGESAGGGSKTDEQVIEHGAELRSSVLMLHRRDIRIGRQVVSTLVEQLLDLSHHTLDVGAEITEATAGDKKPTRRITLEQSISLPARAGTAERLASAMKHLIVLERQAFSLNEEDGGEKPYEERLKDLAEKPT